MTLLQAGSAALLRPIPGLVLVVVAIVHSVGVPVVDVVGVARTLHTGVPALRAVLVRVRGMDFVLGGDHCSSLLCWTASATIWPTCWSAREYTASRPRRSTPTSLAPRSTRRCWETKGWLISSRSTSS